MIFSLDFDGTVTGDPELFKKLAKEIRDAGHKVYIVTMRYPSECKSFEAEWTPLVDGIIATGRKAKKPFVEELGIPVHIWIDDNPIAVHLSAEDIWGTSSPEGTIVIEDHDNGVMTTEVVANSESMKANNGTQVQDDLAA